MEEPCEGSVWGSYRNMTTEEIGLLDKQDFLEQKDVIKKQVLSNGKLTGAQKRQSLQVLECFEKSVNQGGVRQHGITKAMLKAALPVFGKMSEDKRHNEKELRVLRFLTYFVLQGIQK